jgi:hypothetical protein
MVARKTAKRKKLDRRKRAPCEIPHSLEMTEVLKLAFSLEASCSN